MDKRYLNTETACEMSPEAEEMCMQILRRLAEGREVARWIPVSTKPGVHAGMKCSLCKAKISYKDFYSGNHNYCYKCGAKMIKED